VWEQQFTYDAFGNLTKSVPTGATGITWQPGYSSSTNRYTLGGTSYDANGNVLKDTFNTYTWDAEGKNLSSAYDNGGGQTLSFTYDAFGRMVEASVNSTWRTYWYTQAGELVMEGTTILTGRWPTSSGTVETIGTSCCEYLHNDWLGNARIVSSTSNNTVSADQAYTPYGEIYNMFGANNGQYQVFAGTIADLAPGTTTPIMWDTPNRELSYAGRWLSPDPAGSGWNQYAYAGNNPLSYRDPLGLDYCADSGGNVIADEEGGGNDFSCGNAGGNWVEAPDPTNIANSNADVSQVPTFQDDLDFLPLPLWASGVGPSAANNTSKPCKTGFGFGAQGGGDAGAGVGVAGVEATAGAGAGLFFGGGNQPVSAGAFASGGATAYAGSHVAGTPAQTMGSPIALLGGFGAGGGAFITNASSASQLGGPFLTMGTTAAVGELGFSAQVSLGRDGSGNLIWQLNVSYSPGYGLNAYALTTKTRAAATGAQCQ
jgi:RHS repeat-associated protein